MAKTLGKNEGRDLLQLGQGLTKRVEGVSSYWPKGSYRRRRKWKMWTWYFRGVALEVSVKRGTFLKVKVWNSWQPFGKNENAGVKKNHDPQNTKILKTSRVGINDFSFASNSIIMAWESTAQQPMCPRTTVSVLENSCAAVENYSFTRQCVDTANRTDQKQVTDCMLQDLTDRIKGGHHPWMVKTKGRR